jgi:sugar phosphate isomerase/epimerase
MKSGISSWAFRWAIGTQDFTPASPLSVFDFLEKAAEFGAEAVQICENLPVSTMANGELDAVARRAKALGLDLEIGMRGASPENLRKHLNIAARLGAGILRVVLVAPGWEPSLQEQFDILDSFLPKLEQTGITLAIENHFADSPEELRKMVTNIDNPYIGFCLDPVNSISRLIGPKHIIRTLGDLSVTAHAKDARAVRSNTGFYVFGCSLGEGLVDLEGMVQAMKQNPRARTIHVEAWMDRLSSEGPTLIQEEQWVGQGIRYVRSLI